MREDSWTPLTGGVAINRLVPRGLKPATRYRAAAQDAQVLACSWAVWLVPGTHSSRRDAGGHGRAAQQPPQLPLYPRGCHHSRDANGDEGAMGEGTSLVLNFPPKFLLITQPLIRGLTETASISILYLPQALGTCTSHPARSTPRNEQGPRTPLLASHVTGQFCQGFYSGCIQSQSSNIKFGGAWWPFICKSSIECLNFSCIQWRPIK